TAVATGHYARIGIDGRGRVTLSRGLDRGKDQSYFLFGVPETVLAKLWTPLGGLSKDEVRSMAADLALPNANKPDSQELCFVPDGNIGAFVARQRGEEEEGEIRDESGQVLGTHHGISGFTVGQRRGLGLGGGPPRYVLRILP